MNAYSPGCTVLRWKPPQRSAIEVIIYDREYYTGKGDVQGVRCEDWGKASRDWARGVASTSIVGAFVPLP